MPQQRCPPRQQCQKFLCFIRTPNESNYTRNYLFSVPRATGYRHRKKKYREVLNKSLREKYAYILWSQISKATQPALTLILSVAHLMCFERLVLTQAEEQHPHLQNHRQQLETRRTCSESGITLTVSSVPLLSCHNHLQQSHSQEQQSTARQSTSELKGTIWCKTYRILSTCRS